MKVSVNIVMGLFVFIISGIILMTILTSSTNEELIEKELCGDSVDYVSITNDILQGNLDGEKIINCPTRKITINNSEEEEIYKIVSDETLICSQAFDKDTTFIEKTEVGDKNLCFVCSFISFDLEQKERFTGFNDYIENRFVGERSYLSYFNDNLNIIPSDNCEELNEPGVIPIEQYRDCLNGEKTLDSSKNYVVIYSQTQDPNFFENLEIGFNLRILAGSLDTYSSIILDENSVEVYERLDCDSVNG